MVNHAGLDRRQLPSSVNRLYVFVYTLVDGQQCLGSAILDEDNRLAVGLADSSAAVEADAAVTLLNIKDLTLFYDGVGCGERPVTAYVAGLQGL